MVQKIQVTNKILNLSKSSKRHLVVVGGRGKSASHSIARILLMQALEQSLFTPCVREIQKTMQYSVKKLLDDLIKKYNLQYFYHSTKTEISCKFNDSLFTFFGLRDCSADNIHALEGADRCWVEEAQSLSRRSINELRPTIRKEGSQIWWNLNPRYKTDPVYFDYITNDDENAEVLWLTWRDNPWFPDALKLEKDSDYKRNEAEARHIWEGELRDEGELYVVPSEVFRLAMQREISRYKGREVIGADIAHQGGDEIVFIKKSDHKVIDKYISKKQNSIKTTKDLARFAKNLDTVINIDNGDIGKAVADNLESLGFFNVNRINFGGTPKDTDHYYDCVTEMYFNLRDILAQEDSQADFPNDEEMMNQVVQRKYDYINGRRGYEVVKIEAKKDFAKHAINMNSKSPDRADALVLAFYEPDDEKQGYAETVDYNMFN